MTRRLALLLLLLASVFALAGCHEEEPPETAFTPPQLSDDRIALIESAWNQRELFGVPGDADFCELGDTEDGIRYYGSYTFGEGDSATTHDIVYIPCDQLNVPVQITIGDHIFRSRTGFGLYVFTQRVYNNFTTETFSPLVRSFQTEGGTQLIPDQVIATAARLHSAYEQSLYGSELTELPEQKSTTEESRLAEAKATWLLHRGQVPDFEQELPKLRYYGRFEGFDIIFQQTNLPMESSLEIAGYTFSSNTSFVLYACQKGKLQDLRVAFTNGLISENAIAQVASAHKDQQKG